MTSAVAENAPVASVPTGNMSTDSDMPEGAAPIRLPVMVVEGMDTADGRFIEPGALSTRTLPIALYSQIRSSHGSLDGDTATVLAGAITQATRRPGPEVTQLSTGQPFPEGTYVWEGTGWMYQDVPAPPEKAAYTLVKDKALRGNSVDLSEVDATFEYEDGQNLAEDPNPRRIIITSGVIGATTLVGQPAFPDAFIELDGISSFSEDQAVTASGVPAWRASEVGDQCGPCLAVAGPHDDAITAALGYDDPGEESAFVVQNRMGDDLEPDEIAPRHTGGMLALVPSNPNMLRVPDGDPAEELHLTLAYLGDNVLEWDEQTRNAVHDIARAATDQDYAIALEESRMLAQGMADEGIRSYVRSMRKEGPTPEQRGPLTGGIFSHAIFNPNGDNGYDPATVYLLDGSGDRSAIEGLSGNLCYRVPEAIGEINFPSQHTPYVPHITAGYGVPIDSLTYTGPVEFDRLRVALGGEVTDYPLGGGAPIVASIQPNILPPAEIFEQPALDGPTPPTVGEMHEWGAPVYGHLACWGTCHIGFSGKCVTPPRSASGYAYFMVHAARALAADGRTIDIPVGWGTMETGHADVRRGAQAAAEHYDNTGTVAFEYTVGEDAHGIWFAGRMLPHLSEELAVKARGAVFSGDWRTIRGRLELVASLAVNVPGFPVPRVRVASGAPVALVAAGVPRDSGTLTPVRLADGGRQFVDPADLAELLAYVRSDRDAKTVADSLAAVDQLTAIGREALAWQYALAEAELTIALDGDHPWFGGEQGDSQDMAKRKNWVSRAGGLPPYIKRIEKHLIAKGMSESRAIATAKNAAQKMCDTGDTNFPGSQEVNPGSRAEACEAIAQWNAKRKAGSGG